ncbi:MAG: hypothetical protein H8E78_04205 [Proteobacteria bacterium]|nr:hypothetical protein [Pseudomonadota bacterium]
MGHAYRVLRVAFESRAELDREFFNNLVHGGLFIPGAFEFHPVTEPSPELEAGSMPIEVALLEAARWLDEDRRSSHAALPRESGLRVQHRKIDLEDPKLSKVEQSILDLAVLWG